MQQISKCLSSLPCTSSELKDISQGFCPSAFSLFLGNLTFENPSQNVIVSYQVLSGMERTHAAEQVSASRECGLALEGDARDSVRHFDVAWYLQSSLNLE